MVSERLSFQSSYTQAYAVLLQPQLDEHHPAISQLRQIQDKCNRLPENLLEDQHYLIGRVVYLANQVLTLFALWKENGAAPDLSTLIDPDEPTPLLMRLEQVLCECRILLN